MRFLWKYINCNIDKVLALALALITNYITNFDTIMIIIIMIITIVITTTIIIIKITILFLNVHGLSFLNEIYNAILQ